MFQTPITINETINNINRKKYLLPSIQRELVWSPEQIEKLFDSLMRDYPIGSFLFWLVEKKINKKYQFYEFMRNYHEKDSKHNEKANISGEDDVTAILDGQQRLTSLYLGLKGTYAYKLPRKRWDNPEAYPVRELYLNLLKKADDQDLVFDFRFLTKDEAVRDLNNFWFKLGDILNLEKPYDVNNYLIKNKLMQLEPSKAQFANETLFKLYDVIFKKSIINYYLETDPDLEKVLQIFVRVNSGGTPLSYSDILLSMATAQWQQKDAREEILKFVDDINGIGSGFNIDKDFILKTCLVLSDFSDIAFKVTNFDKDNMLVIENNWDKISKAILMAMKLASYLGFNRDTLTSNYAIIPIAYYLLKKGIPRNYLESTKTADERSIIHKWIIVSLLKRFFGGVPDNVLRPIRDVLKNDDLISFPLDKIINKFRGETKTLVFDSDEIENLFSYQYGKAYTFTTISILYPTLDFKNKFHMDHIYPKSLFTKSKLLKAGISDETKIEFYLDNYNGLANLQLLEGIPNQEKFITDFKEWFFKVNKTEQERSEYRSKHYIPDIDLSFENFEQFIIKRTELMWAAFANALELGIDTGSNQGKINRKVIRKGQIIYKVSDNQAKPLSKLHTRQGSQSQKIDEMIIAGSTMEQMITELRKDQYRILSRQEGQSRTDDSIQRRILGHFRHLREAHNIILNEIESDVELDP